MKKFFVFLFSLLALGACTDYENEMEVLNVSIQLVFPESYTDEKSGLRVELQDATASTFVDSTDTAGIAHFIVPAGIYKATSSSQKLTYDYRYFFNGTRNQVIVTSDSTNVIPLKLTMSRKRIVH